MSKIDILIIITFLSCVKITAQCNGSASLCDKKYNEVSFLTTHNSFNSEEDNFSYPNQNFNITRQLNDGVRALMIDVYDVSGTSTVYHGNKFLGSLPLTTLLTSIKTFLDNNPKEIVTIILECYTTANKIETDVNQTGLNSYLYTHTGNNWPTLQTMIDNGTRLVIFSDEDDASATQAWYHYVWDHAVETHYTAHDQNDFSCNYNRGSATNDLFILNHFITTQQGAGSESSATTVNSNPYFYDRVIQCYDANNKFPNFITVDFYDKGNAIDVVNQMNQPSSTLNINKEDEEPLQIYISTSFDYINVSKLLKTRKYSIYNILGVEVSNGIISDNKTINIQELNTGLYFLKFNNENNFKFVKK